MLNLSSYSNSNTARTCQECALQRAENLAILGVSRVLELCVGPSLETLEKYYSKFNIKVVGNDIDPRWKEYHPNGDWIIGDATQIDKTGFDAIVVAPPLSRGCSGKREDALSINQVIPSYYDFLNLPSRISVYVLPGKTLSIREDKKQLYKFLKSFSGKVELIPLKNKITKYLDVYVINE